MAPRSRNRRKQMCSKLNCNCPNCVYADTYKMINSWIKLHNSRLKFSASVNSLNSLRISFFLFYRICKYTILPKCQKYYIWPSPLDSTQQRSTIVKHCMVKSSMDFSAKQRQTFTEKSNSGMFF